MSTYNRIVFQNRQDWLDKRNLGIGGSDAGIILGLSEWKSVYEVWGEKLGIFVNTDFKSPRMFFGTVFEDTIRNVARYWDTDFETTKANYEAKNIVRKIIKPNCMFQSKKYPWMIGNVDGIYTDVKTKERGIIEIKTISKYMLDRYLNGIPPYHYAQLLHYLVITGFSHGMLIMVVDNSDIKVYKFGRNPENEHNLITKEKEFWDKIVRCKEIMKENNTSDINSVLHIIQKEGLEPEADGSVGLERYLSERFKEHKNNILMGTLDDLKALQQAKLIRKNISEQETKTREIYNAIKIKLGSEFDTLDFGEAGSVSWKSDKNGTRRFIDKTKELEI